MVIEKHEKSNIEIKTKDETVRRTDVYLELMKIDDLRKRGILTEAEFEAQKAKLLSGN